MLISLDHEPDARSAWRSYHRRRRMGFFSPNHDGDALLITMLATVAFWAVVAYALSAIL